MGDFVKKWLAGIGAAGVVTVIAVIAIGKMERKSTPAVSNNVTLDKAATGSSATGAGVQSPSATQSPSVMAAPGPTSGQSTGVPSESSNTSASPKPSARVARSQPSAALGNTDPSVGSLPPTSVTRDPATNIPGSTPIRTEVAQSAPASAPPDTATPSPETVVNPAAMQISEAEGMNVTGNVSVNGEFSKVSRLVYPNKDEVFTPGQNGALVTAKGNAIALGASTQFKPDSMNSFHLDAGASNVNTQSGMTTRLNDWRVQPVHPDGATQYEVTYANDGVYVYARVNDVDVINDICPRRIRLEQGKAVRIPSTRGCAVAWLNEGRTWPYKVVWGAAAAAGTGVILSLRQDMSPSSPSQTSP